MKRFQGTSSLESSFNLFLISSVRIQVVYAILEDLNDLIVKNNKQTRKDRDHDKTIVVNLEWLVLPPAIQHKQESGVDESEYATDGHVNNEWHLV